jgi:hypothetical protein
MRFLAAGLITASVLASSSAFAAMDKPTHERFVSRCESSMYMSAGECGCMAGIADKKLDDLAVAYLALDPLDVRNSAAMSKKMTGAELASVDNFMKTAPHACKGAK